MEEEAAIHYTSAANKLARIQGKALEEREKQSIRQLQAPDPALRQPQIERIAGRDTAAGMANLLRRSVPPRELLGVCYQQWHDTAATRSPRLRERTDEINQLLDRHRRDPVAGYQAAAQALQRKDITP